jgi:hypothetical protein
MEGGAEIRIWGVSGRFMGEQDIQDDQDDEWIFTICTRAALPKYILPILPTLFHSP